ncbi:MAG: hypothetical protein AAFZ18_18980, partial [Myxococcota bacterium]
EAGQEVGYVFHARSPSSVLKIDARHLGWADFFRFLAGWAPGHWKMNAYSRRMTARALEQL